MLKICVASQKGGSGKSTTAINLAGAAAAARKRVIILDADPQQTSGQWRGIRTDAGLGQPDVRAIDADDIVREIEACSCSSYDVVIVDTAPHGEAAFALTRVAAAVDIVVVPVMPSMPDMAAYPNVVSIVRASGRPGAAVLSRMPPRAPEEVEMREVLPSHGLTVAPQAIYDRRSVMRAFTAGQTISEYEPLSPAVAEYAALYHWLSKEVSK